MLTPVADTGNKLLYLEVFRLNANVPTNLMAGNDAIVDLEVHPGIPVDRIAWASFAKAIGFNKDPWIEPDG